MPKQTFFNLPEDKRDKIIEASIDEFARNAYVNASITKIAESAGVAKGSMYQYFLDKKDLYRFILDMIGQRKMEHLQGVMEQKDRVGFIPFVGLLFQSGLEFALQNPVLALIGNNFIKELNPEIRDDILKDAQAESNRFFGQLIEQAKARGDLRKELNTEMGAMLIYHFNNLLMEWVDLSRIAHGDPASIEDYTEKVEALLDIMKHGYQNE